MKQLLRALRLLLLLSSGTAIAAPVTFNITGTVSGTGTSWDGSAITGSVTYEDSLVTGIMPVDIYPPNASITVNAFGQTFTQADDLDNYQLFGVLTIVPTLNQLALTFIVGESGGVNPKNIQTPEFSRFELNIDPSDLGQASYVATVTTTIAPVGSMNVAMQALPEGPKISWSILNGLGAAGQAAVELQKLNPTNFQWSAVATIPSGTTNYTDTASAGGAFLYRVKYTP